MLHNYPDVSNRRGEVIEGSVHVGKFPIEKGREEAVQVGKLLYYKVIQFSTYFDPDRSVKFNRRGC